MLKPLLSFALSFIVAIQSAFANGSEEFFCRRLLENENAEVQADLITVKRFARAPVEVLKILENGVKTFALNRIIDRSTEILFGWEMKGRRPILLLYFHNLEVRIAVYPPSNATDPAGISYTIKESAYAEKGVYFVARSTPQKIGAAYKFVQVIRGFEDALNAQNHVYTSAQRLADLNKLLSLFFLEPVDGAKKVKFNYGVLTHPVVIGNLSIFQIKERLSAVKRWQVITDDDVTRPNRASRFFMITGAVGIAILVALGVYSGLSR